MQKTKKKRSGNISAAMSIAKKSGGKLAGRGRSKKDPADGTKGGYAVGDKHSDPSGGISAEVGTEKRPIKFEGNEVVITAPAVLDNKTLHEFNGKKMTQREILSAINVNGGGVSFAKGGRMPKKIRCNGSRYEYGGKLMSDHEIVKSCGCKHSKALGGAVAELSPESAYFIEKMKKGRIARKSLFKNSPKYSQQIKGLQSAIDAGYIFIKPNPVDSNEVYVRPTQKLQSEYYQSAGISETDENKKLIADFAAIDKPDSYMVRMSEGNPEALLAFVQEQATGMTQTRDTVNTNFVSYNHVTETVGKDLTLRAVAAIPQEQKDMIIKAWKGKALDPELRKALRKKTMAAGGEVGEKGASLVEFRKDKMMLPVSDESVGKWKVNIFENGQVVRTFYSSKVSSAEAWEDIFKAYKIWKSKTMAAGGEVDGGRITYYVSYPKMVEGGSDNVEASFADIDKALNFGKAKYQNVTYEKTVNGIPIETGYVATDGTKDLIPDKKQDSRLAAGGEMTGKIDLKSLTGKEVVYAGPMFTAESYKHGFIDGETQTIKSVSKSKTPFAGHFEYFPAYNIVTDKHKFKIPDYALSKFIETGIGKWNTEGKNDEWRTIYTIEKADEETDGWLKKYHPNRMKAAGGELSKADIIEDLNNSNTLSGRSRDYRLMESTVPAASFARGGALTPYPDLSVVDTSNVINDSQTLFDVPEAKVSTRPKEKTIREIELSMKDVKGIPAPSIRSSSDINDFLLSIWEKNLINVQECFYVVYLNSRNSVIGYQQLSKGGITATVADPELIVATASKALASAVIVSHNHPSGSLRPSKADEEMTERIQKALQYVNVKLLDHLIINNQGGYYSFADEGMISYKAGGMIFKKGGETPGDTNAYSSFHTYKGPSHKYENAYQLNKAIEELLDSKKEDAPDDFSVEQKQFLQYYSGYGGLEKYGAEGKGLLYEYFTPSLISEKMWGLAYKHGFKGGRVLEPAAGIGEFIKYAPDKNKVTAYEINPYSARIMQVLFPTTHVFGQYFEEIFIVNRNTIKGKVASLPKYDLVIGNPPYGEFLGKFAGMGEKQYTRAGNYIDYFIFRGLDLLNPGGLLVFIVGAEVAAGGKPFLQQKTNTCKEEIAEKSDLIDAYRLPNGVFERTDVLTDIIVLKKK